MNKKKVCKGSPMYSKELAQKICDVIATTPKGLTELCKEYDFFPARSNIYEWKWKYPEFNEMYIAAKMHQTELMAESLLDETIIEPYYDENGNKRIDSGTVSAQRLKIDTMKFLAIKLAPRIYGDKIQTESTITIKHEDALKELE